MSRTKIRSTSLAAGFVLALTLAVGACSSSSSSSSTTTTTPAQAYCGSWQEVVDAFNSFNQVDILGKGLDSLKAPTQQLQTAVDHLGSTSDAMLRPKVDALVSAVKDVGTTVSSNSLSVDTLTRARTAVQNVQSAWNDLVSTLRTTCPEVRASTV